MGRPPIGKVAMTATERSHRHRARLAASKPVKDSDCKPAGPADDTEVATLRRQLQEATETVGALHAELHTTRNAYEARILESHPSQQSSDGEMLAPSARAKLEAAKRAMERRLNAEHAARMRGIDEEVRQRVIKATKERLERLDKMEAEVYDKEKWYRTLINDHKPPFTVDQYRIILMCLHPDGERTPAKLQEAFILLESKKEILTGEKKKRIA